MYLLFFLGIQDPDVLVYLVRGMYLFWSMTAYLFLIFIILFKTIVWEAHKKWIAIFVTLVGILSVLTLWTDLIISNVIYDTVSKIYYEDFWEIFFIYTFLYALYIPLILFFSYRKLKSLSRINKIRFYLFLLGYGFMMVCWYVFLVILPMYDIWLFEKQQVLFIIPLLVVIFYSSYRYNFIDIEFFFSKLFHFVVASFLSIGVIFMIHYYIEEGLNTNLRDFWGILWGNIYVDIFAWIVLFLLFHFLLQKIFPGNQKYTVLIKQLWKIRKKLSYLYNIWEVNRFLEKEMKELFQINSICIHLDTPESSLENIKKYFQKNTRYDLFINDIVFIEENKNKFDYEKIADEIDSRTYLVFPLFTLAGRFLGVLELWSKNFRDAYTTEEIELLQDFTQYLVSHIKYTEIYKEIQDLNVNLDKKVDEKTMMYNNLLNKQTDFISMASHEIKNPLWSAIFQLDCLIDDIKEKAISEEKILEELEVLNTQIVRVGTLTKNIFSSQKYDLEKVELYKQNICIDDFLSNKIELNQKWFPEIEFLFFTQQENIYNTIDKIQFEQVIDNLVNNSIKFIPKDSGKIQLSLYLKKEKMYVNIEDNGPGFSLDEAEGLFDKYTSGDIKNTWLWMGLYLCKKIIEFHEGKITAGKSETLGWAKFEIELPITNTVDSNYNM